jgi:hypothetical protein
MGDGSRPVIVFHDLNSMYFSFQPFVKRVLGDRLAVFDGGMERRPATAQSLAAFVAERPGTQAVCARYVQPAIVGGPAETIRSVVSVAHPILRMLRRIETTWTRFADARADTLPADADLASVVTQGLVLPLQKYPYVNFHVALISGDLQNKQRTSAVSLASTLVAKAGVGLTDFPDTLLATMRRELAKIGIDYATDDIDLPRPSMVDALRHWERTLPADAWARLCRLNGSDLLFFDEVAAQVCREASLPDPLRQEIRAAVDEAAALTRHRAADAVRSAGPRAQAGQNGEVKTLVEPDPVLGWRLQPNREITIAVAGESVVMQSDASGCRPVPGQPAKAPHTLSAYGCSCVFGWGVPVEQTFCALLQARHDDWRVENHGVNGYGQGQNLLQLMRDLRWNDCDFVTFCWINPHLTRNVADVQQVQRQTEQASAGKAALIRFMPRAVLDAHGDLSFREVAYSRPELMNLDLSDFTPDPHYLDLVCFALLKRAPALVRERGGHFFVTVLLDTMSPGLARMLRDEGIPVVDAAVSGTEYVNPFELSHPNALANQVYAERIEAHLIAHFLSQVR